MTKRWIVVLSTLAASGLAPPGGVGAQSGPIGLAPPAAAERPPGPGPLFIVGGGSQPPALIDRFIELAGGRERARILVIPLASGSPEESGAGKVEQFVEHGAGAFMLIPTAKDAREGLGAKLDGVTGVWFTGGDQTRITAVLSGTPLLDEIHALRRRGAVIGGTSAGAAIMSDSMLTGNQTRADSTGYYGDEFPLIARATIEVVPGLGFLPGTIVDQHFLARERHNRLLSAVLERPSLMGIGIDESTAVEVAGDGRWTVRGESQVIVYDARAARITEPGPPLGAAGIRVHLLPPGSVFDPRSGAVAFPVSAVGSTHTSIQENQP